MANYRAYPEYSPDGFPTSWEQKRLRFALRMNPSKTEIDLDNSDLVSFVPMDAVGEYGGIRLNEEKELSEIGSGYTYFCDDDVVVAKITPCFENGKGALAKRLKNKTAFGTTELHVMRAGPEQLEPQFLFYLTISDLFRKIGESEMYGAGGQKRVPESFFKDFRAGIPPIREQQAISRFLDLKTAQIDSLIAKKKALLDKLAEKRTALINHAATKGLDPSVTMKDSGVAWLGEIPAHWQRMLMVRVISKFEQGWSPSCDEREASLDEWGVLKSGCVNYGVFQEQEHKTLPPSIDPIPSLEVKAGDILMCRASGSKHLIGSVAMVRKCRSKLIFSDKTYRITLQPNIIDSEFFVLLMKSKYLRDQIELSISGADGLANNIPQSSVKGYQIVLPSSVGEQKEISTFLNKKSESIETQEVKILEAIGRLQEYRAALITNSVTGKIDVRGFEIPQPAEGITS